MRLSTPVALLVLAISPTDALLPGLNSSRRHTSRLKLLISLPDFFSFTKGKVDNNVATNNENKSALLELLQAVPRNKATPKELTADILKAVGVLEKACPTSEEDVLPRLSGNWELIWTAQDVSMTPKNMLSTWIK